MADTFNEDLFDAMVRHQIGIQRFSSSVRNRVWALLDATEKDLKRQIRGATRAGLDSPARIESLNVLLGKLKKSRLRGWKNAREVWFEEMRELSRVEPGFFDRVFASSFPGVELGTVLPDAEVLRKIVTSTPFMGKTLKGWADDVQAKDIARIEDAIKIGMTQGETLPQISKRVVGSAALRGRDGVTQITRRNAAAITRTVTNGVAAQARAAYAEANKDLAPEEMFTATLDARTTFICRRFDGQVFNVGKGPVLPLHFGERSIYSPIVDGKVIGERPRRDFTERSLLRDFAKKEKLGKVPLKRDALTRGSKGAFDSFARARMRELTGTVPAKVTYGQWLGRQSAAIQDDILGPTRGALFRRGGLKIDKFVEINGTELTLAQLADRHTSAFLRAGLDPADFAD